MGRDERPAVGRDEAAGAVGVSAALAAFHLDRLVETGLLVPEYRRLSGRTGPGAGRPAKLYRRAPREVSVSLPERRYETAARLFAETMEGLGGGTAARRDECGTPPASGEETGAAPRRRPAVRAADPVAARRW